MKADERKEIEVNKLSAWIARMKTRMQGRALYVFVGTLVMVVAVGAIIWFWRNSVAAADSARWMDFRTVMEADEPKKYDQLIGDEKHNDKVTVKLARFMKARHIMYFEGMDRLGSPRHDDRVNALIKVEEGRKLYEEVANELGDYPVLQQEAWLSCAKAEETLLGLPRADGNGTRGDFNRMIEYLKKAAAINAGSDASKNYDQRIATRSAQQDEILKFYQQCSELSERPRFNPPPSLNFPPRGPGPGFDPGGPDLGP